LTEALRGKVFFLPGFFSRRVREFEGAAFGVCHVPDGEAEEVGDAQGGVDAQHEEQPVSLTGQEPFHGSDFFRVPDRFDEVHNDAFLPDDIINNSRLLSR
jgi:hypothetical protein